MPRVREPTNHGKRWTMEDIKRLRHLYVDNGFSIRDIANKLERKVSGVVGKLNGLGLIDLSKLTDNFNRDDEEYWKSFDDPKWGNARKQDIDALVGNGEPTTPYTTTFDAERLGRLHSSWVDSFGFVGVASAEPSNTVHIKGDLIVDGKIKQCNNVNSNNTGESKMRRVVTINIFDDSKGLPVELSLVGTFKDIPTEDDNESVIREILMDGSEYEPDKLSVAKLLEQHNKVRKNTVDLGILERTGQTVKLRPIKLKDLRFTVVG